MHRFYRNRDKAFHDNNNINGSDIKLVAGKGNITYKDIIDNMKNENTNKKNDKTTPSLNDNDNDNDNDSDDTFSQYSIGFIG